MGALRQSQRLGREPCGQSNPWGRDLMPYGHLALKVRGEPNSPELGLWLCAYLREGPGFASLYKC